MWFQTFILYPVLFPSLLISYAGCKLKKATTSSPTLTFLTIEGLIELRSGYQFHVIFKDGSRNPCGTHYIIRLDLLLSVSLTFSTPFKVSPRQLLSQLNTISLCITASFSRGLGYGHGQLEAVLNDVQVLERKNYWESIVFRGHCAFLNSLGLPLITLFNSQVFRNPDYTQQTSPLLWDHTNKRSLKR